MGSHLIRVGRLDGVQEISLILARHGIWYRHDVGYLLVYDWPEHKLYVAARAAGRPVIYNFRDICARRLGLISRRR